MRTVALTELAEIVLTVERPHPVRVAIDGCSAAGKTTLADELADVLRARSQLLVPLGPGGGRRYVTGIRSATAPGTSRASGCTSTRSSRGPVHRSSWTTRIRPNPTLTVN
ncbi:hypothetical protein [Kribbella sp. NBC_00889]|uniref:hypothetical protein n=1 Tax=Kribbella sp. NBC_00889 TaxID=2975974 RepID=UPI003870AEB5|nr:hypothetical protein OG817_02750 [Kribbella sp. NBC_00889]